MTVRRRLSQGHTEACECGRSEGEACGVVCHEFGLMWTQLSDEVRLVRRLFCENSKRTAAGADVQGFDNRLPHRTSVKSAGAPLQTCTNRLLYFGSRSSVGLVGFPHRTDRQVRLLRSSHSGTREQHAIAVGASHANCVGEREQERTHGASL